jgi:hypothetical protein
VTLDEKLRALRKAIDALKRQRAGEPEPESEVAAAGLEKVVNAMLAQVQDIAETLQQLRRDPRRPPPRPFSRR